MTLNTVRVPRFTNIAFSLLAAFAIWFGGTALTASQAQAAAFSFGNLPSGAGGNALGLFQEPTETFTDTPSDTATNTWTPSITLTPSNTPSFTNTPTKTFTPSITLTPSKTSTASKTPTATWTPSVTRTPTNTPTITPTPTIVAQWHFDEGSGVIAYDAVGDNDGTITGNSGTATPTPSHPSLWTTDGQLGGALRFGTPNQYVNVDCTGNPCALTPYYSYSVSIWINPMIVTSGMQQTIVMKGDDYAIRLNEDGYVELETLVTNPDIVLTGPILPINTWSNIVSTYDYPSRQVKLFVNGQLIAAQSFESGGTSPTDLRFGANSNGAEIFQGRLDEVTIYSRALQLADVQAQYNAVISTITPTPTANPASLLDNLVGYWELEEASGTRVDAHGSNDLTDMNTVTQASGKVASAGDFNRATSEYLRATDTPELSTGDIDFTISAWVYLDSLTADGGIVSKASTGTTANQEYFLYHVSSSNRFVFTVTGTNGIAASVTANNFGAATAGQWYFVTAWHDAGNNSLNIQVNNGSVNSVTHLTAVKDLTNYFEIGRTTASRYWDGRIDQVGLWKRVLTAQQRSDLYNNGAGLSYYYLDSGAPPQTPTPTPSATSTIVPSTLLSNLVAYWHLDEEGGLREDAIATNDLTDSNTVEQDPGVLGWAADFSHTSSESLYIADSPIVSVVSNQSKAWAGWFKLESFTGDWQSIIGKWASSGSNYDYMLRVNPTTQELIFYTRYPDNSNTTAVTATNHGTLNLGEWYFVYVYHDSQADTIGISVNGGVPNTAANTVGVRNGTGTLYLGRRYDGNYLDGQLDEWGIWDRVLTTEEVGALYNGGQGLYHPFDGSPAPSTATPEPHVSLTEDLVAYWGLEEATGLRYDPIGANNLTDNNTVGQANGISGYAADIEFASSESLSRADNPVVSVTSNQSKAWAGWFKLESFTGDWQSLLGKWASSGSNYDYMLRVNPTTQELIFYTRYPDNSNTTSVTATNLGALSLGQWYFVYVYHDEHEDEIGISVNGGVPNTAANTVGVRNGTGALYLGRRYDGNYLDGQLDEWTIWDRVLSPVEVDYLYHGGLGRSYPFESDLSTDPPSVTLPQGLAAYWHLDEETGVREDVLGTSDLTDNNTVGRDFGILNYAADLERNHSESLSTTDSALVSVAGHADKSWAGWFRIEELSEYGGGLTLMGKGLYGNFDYQLETQYQAGYQKLVFYVQKADNSGSIWVTSTETINAGEWYFVYIFHNEHDDLIGLSINGGPATTVASSYGVRDGTSALFLGRAESGGNSFDGQLDEWGIWDRVLSNQEVQALYNDGVGLPHPFDGVFTANPTPSPTLEPNISLQEELVAYWPLEEATGDRVDPKGGNDLTDNNTVGQGTGPVNNSASFESTGSETLSIADNPDVSGAGFTDKSWAGWLKLSSAATMTVMGKPGSNPYEYVLLVNIWQGNPRLDFNAGNGFVSIANLNIDEWYFVYTYYDTKEGEIGLSINNQPPIIAIAAAGIYDGTQPFYLGGSGFDGELDEWAIWDRVLTADELTFLYNNGDGRTYPFENPEPPVGVWLETIYGYDNGPAHGVTSVERPGQ